MEEDTEQVIDTIKKSLGVTEILVLTGFVDQELVKMSSVSWQRGEYLNLLVRRPKILEQFRTSFDFISYQELGTKDL